MACTQGSRGGEPGRSQAVQPVAIALSGAYLWVPTDAPRWGKSKSSGGQLHPLLVGVAIALSLDAMAQAAYFAARGGSHSGVGALMTLAFGAAMVLADAGNGYLLSWCAQRSDSLARTLCAPACGHARGAVEFHRRRPVAPACGHLGAEPGCGLGGVCLVAASSGSK